MSVTLPNIKNSTLQKWQISSPKLSNTKFLGTEGENKII